MHCSIVHKGVVRSITDDTISVAIATQSACGDCHAKNICGFTEVSEKIVHIPNDNLKDLQIGDEIHVTMDSSLGTKAVLLAYIIPLFILIATLFICLLFTNELLAALIAIILVACYYVILHKIKNHLNRKFSFSII